MKSTISGRPNKHSIEYPCLMVDKQDKDLILLVALNGTSFRVTSLVDSSTWELGESIGYSQEDLEEEFEYFTGSLTIEND